MIYRIHGVSDQLKTNHHGYKDCNALAVMPCPLNPSVRRSEDIRPDQLPLSKDAKADAVPIEYLTGSTEFVHHVDE